MLPPKRTRQPMGIRTDERSCPCHLKWIRSFVCCAFKSGDCEGPTEAHHVREGGNAGTGLKPPDADTVPLCAKHHAEGHAIGWRTFEARHGIDLSAKAEQFARVSPHLRKMRI